MDRTDRIRRHRLAVLAALALTAALPASAVDEVNVSNGLTGAGAPLALHGYDPVAYFTDAAPTRGSASFALVHGGATYYFASEEHLDAFEANPAKFAPAYGGFCAYGVSVGKKFDGNPLYWKVANGRLYLNLNADIARKFEEDVPGSVAKAERQWALIAQTPIADL